MNVKTSFLYSNSAVTQITSGIISILLRQIERDKFIQSQSDYISRACRGGSSFELTRSAAAAGPIHAAFIFMLCLTFLCKLSKTNFRKARRKAAEFEPKGKSIMQPTQNNVNLRSCVDLSWRHAWPGAHASYTHG
jgi:hypothetical protein